MDPRCDHLLPTGWVGASLVRPAETEFMVSQLCLVCGKHVKLSDVSLWTRPRYSLVVDEDVKKPNKQSNTPAATVATTTIRIL